MERIAGYELSGLIGDGGVREVWRAHHLERDRDVAVQVLQVLDTSTAVTATVPTGRAPSGVAVGPGGRKACVPALLDGALTGLNVGGP